MVAFEVVLSDADYMKRAAAEAALAEIEPGMCIGLGTGSTAWHFTDLLGERVAAGLECVCVPTSEVTADQARELGIPLADLAKVPELDITVDGADEIAPDLALIKGGGGALLREKIVAAASRRMVVIADQSKRVEALGQFPLPIEVNRFGLTATSTAVAALVRASNPNGVAELRHTSTDEPFVTDGGHLIIDAFFGRISDAEALSNALLNIPGVVQHGLFIGMCKIAYLAGPDGVTTVGA